MIRKILSILFAVTAIAASGYDNDRYFTLMGEADKAIAGEDWSLAEEKLTEALRTQPANPSNVLLMSNLGMVRYHAGRYDEALTTLDDAHIMAPASVTVLQNRARILAELGRLEESYRDYTTIINLDTTLIEPRFYHAVIAMEMGLTEQATNDVESMKIINPSHRLTNLSEATLLIRQGRYDEAIPPLSRVIDIEPAASHYASRALCRLMTSQLGDAAEDIASGLELDPLDGELYLYRALLNKMRYRQDDAEADGRQAIKLGIKENIVKSLIY